MRKIPAWHSKLIVSSFIYHNNESLKDNTNIAEVLEYILEKYSKYKYSRKSSMNELSIQTQYAPIILHSLSFAFTIVVVFLVHLLLNSIQIDVYIKCNVLR